MGKRATREAARPEASASGHFAETPTRSFEQIDGAGDGPLSAPRRPPPCGPSPRPPARGWGCATGGGRRVHHLRCFGRRIGAPSGNVGERPLHRDADAQLRRTILPDARPSWVAQRASRSPMPTARSATRRPRSVAATRRARMGMRDAGGAAMALSRGRLANGVPLCRRTVIQEPDTSPGCRRAPARPRRGCAGG
jgi:hypothetical protein